MRNMLQLIKLKGLKINISDDDLLSRGIIIVKRPMPYEIKGLAISCGNMYQIEINESVPDDQQCNAFLHELQHIVNNDFDRDEPVEDIEAENPY